MTGQNGKKKKMSPWTGNVKRASDKLNTQQHTSIQAAWVPLAGGALEQRSWSGDQRACLSGLSLSPTTVTKLGAQCQELSGSGCHLSGGQPDHKEHWLRASELTLDHQLAIIFSKICTLCTDWLKVYNTIPEEGVMFYTHFPQLLGSLVIR